MKIDVNYGSKGEVFCCSVKKAKETFKDTEVYLNFGYLGKYFIAYGREIHFNYVHKNVKGKVLCKMQMYNQQKEPNVILSFYLTKEDAYTEQIRKEFEKEYLPLVFDIYNKKLNDDSVLKTTTLVLVEVIDHKLKLHQKEL